VKISAIEASTVALYFSASWCPPCRRFTPTFVEVYEELTSQDNSLEVVFVSRDRDEESFNAYLAKMPWLAVPLADSECLQRLMKGYKVNGIPNLGVKFISEYGIGASPFTLQRINELKEQEKAAKDNQTIHSVLGTPTRDYLISSEGDKVPISVLEGKYVALFFMVRPIDEFTAVLTKIYEKLRAVGEKFEVVAVYFGSNESMCDKLVRYFELTTLPTLVLIGPDGNTLNNNIADVIEEHGSEAWEGFPFNAEKLEIFADKSKTKAASQSLESLLVKDDLELCHGKRWSEGIISCITYLSYICNNFLNKTNGQTLRGKVNNDKYFDTEVPVSELVGKTVILYFSTKWCPPCRDFLPTLVKEYKKMKEKNRRGSYDEFFSDMPWLALPLGDERKELLMKKFRIREIPSLIVIGPSGLTLTKDAKSHLLAHGADAFPFTEETLQELEKKLDGKAKAWPEKVKHELVLKRSGTTVTYSCDGCEGLGSSWS
uniref:protein-disulfide reductase n=1 Tax=Setaria italica TaxID=4555 RepID=K4AJ13_SETIT